MKTIFLHDIITIGFTMNELKWT